VPEVVVDVDVVLDAVPEVVVDVDVVLNAVPDIVDDVLVSKLKQQNNFLVLCD
jgi:hypothetical protein